MLLRRILLGCALLSVLFAVTLFCLAAGALWMANRPALSRAVLPSPTASPTIRVPSPVPAAPSPPPSEPTAMPPALTVRPAPATANETLVAIETATPPERDLFALAKGFGRIPLDATREVQPRATNYVVGDRETFWVSNVASTSHFTATAVLRLQTPHANWWVQDGLTVAQSDLEKSAQVFETRSYPTNRRFFGSEWSPGIDNDPRLHIFLGEVPGVGGYFSSADEYPHAINPYSNEKEMFYINLDAARPGESTFDGYLAHEFQHMVHWNLDSNEDLWVNEGLSELAVKLNGFSLGNAPAAFAREPDRQLTQWDSASIPNYGAAYLFMSYFLQRFGEDAMRAVVANPANGAAGFDTVLRPLGLSFDQVFADWITANELNEPRIEGGKFSYSDRADLTPSLSATHTSFPVVATGTVHQYGADYLRAAPPTGVHGALTVAFEGSTQVSILPTTPVEGRYFVWSNRGDASDTGLTRAFDLTGLTHATLDFAAWYDLESGWDYAYVSVSTDGGTTWTIVRATTTTDHDPNGNAFGPSFTGRSGLGLVELDDPRPPQWIQEQVDLSPFTGQQVLIRFQTITDDAINRPGLAVDDIRIPELDYSQGFEEGLGGWKLVGAVRVDNVLPQRYSVQVIARGDGPPLVQQLPLDATNRGQITIPGIGEQVHDVLIVIAGMTPVTSEQAPYSYRLSLSTGQ
ncbi:MAG TPA: hypothetical protein DEP84_17585 [Chloroflexi bacterium]|nr:hypothetical protein [Chloroflexota bacterium]